ncbi:phytoene desaturase family protein [Prauserella cavernicola]|uniref:NAD(P)/FAD-dependent oxidoreductase n=1 Tax=Prauserella cavernicola TaxID=2800127 RepID=A0A934V4V9_9PSEU|nr:NAD(P)/FAD-dependent oxidoreductase [Prauserella cavernicola]MBK1785817.1 NAD(P)/FAD-dependent oxidoreductase [Prauserella cavernicola]
MDVAIVGTGPNGLAAGVVLARAGLTVALFEAGSTPGGGLRSTTLFDSEVVHDICSAVHPLGAASRFFREFDLGARGVEMCVPSASYAHPLDDAPAGIAFHSLDRTCERLGRDGARWRRLLEPLVRHSESIADLVLSDQRHVPPHVLAAAALAPRALLQGSPLANRLFTEPTAPALLAGVAAHSLGRLPSLPGGAVAMLLGHLAHAGGWPVPKGGSQRIVDAMVADIKAHGGTIHTGTPIEDLREVASARAVLLNVSPTVLLDLAGSRLPTRYRDRLARFRYGPASAKVDFLVSEPVPWRDPEVRAAPTVHLGGGHREIAASESAVQRGRRPANPFVLVVDPTAADPDRARPGKRPLWTYCHVPNGDPVDPTEAITAQLERFAPGFRDTVLASRAITAPEFETYNRNYVGGDIAGGAVTVSQMLARPTLSVDPYATPLRGVYLCSGSTPPGPSVHGMAGYHAARNVLRKEFGIRTLPRLQPGPPVNGAEGMR